MPRPFKYQIPHLNMLLGAFESWGVGKWATIQDVIVRSNIALDMTEAETLAQHLLADGYIKESLKVKGYNLAQVPGTGMVDIPYGDAGYELTPKGKQFHLDGGYRLEQAPRTRKPINSPGINAKENITKRFAVVEWFREHPVGVILSLVGFASLSLFWIWVDKNWDGQWSIVSFKSLFGLSP